MALNEPTEPTGKTIETPKVDWEKRGYEMLGNVLDTIHGPYSKLLNSATGFCVTDINDDHPGVETTLRNRIINTAEVYKNTASKDDVMEHVFNSAEELAKQVEGRLAEIRNLAKPSSETDVNNVAVDARKLLGIALSTQDQEAYDEAALKLSKLLNNEVRYVREGAASGRRAAHEIEEVSEDENFKFNKWWGADFKVGYHETVRTYVHDLQAFMENVKDRNRIFQEATKHLDSDVRPDLVEPVDKFISEFRKSKFQPEASK